MLPIRRYNQSWMPSIFDDLFANDYANRTNATAPAINVLEDEKAYHVELAAPGMSKENFNIHVDDDNNLVIKMEKKQEQEEDDKKAQRYLRREFSYTKFQQTLILPEDVDKKGISASVENGVLNVVLPKIAPEQKQKTLQHIEVL
ncbi:MAG: Hsp20/alpha crystallin family protein [Alloprevotella sp.]|nr:Hsp20/alpha crystallin family protein [Alloprevotella sp.]